MQNLIYIDGKSCKEKDSLFKTFAKTLNFPDYFSPNWDSFEEIMHDLEFKSNDSIIILDSEFLLKDFEEDKDILKDILKQVNEEQLYQIYKQKRY